ncbi:MAG: hypothetical protein GY943_36615 [Chloroflexi bacterium]|nr:hypothetical protein [Chloroflexota bacterium]
MSNIMTLPLAIPITNVLVVASQTIGIYGNKIKPIRETAVSPTPHTILAGG